jgi:hypothetical protein
MYFTYPSFAATLVSWLSHQSCPFTLTCQLNNQSPSFFANDLRKLTLVSYSTLLHRAQQQGVEGNGIFFGGIRNALVLSIQGGSEADRMSGGDYDGDRAWVSWNNDLLSCLPDNIKAEDTSGLTTLISDQEQKLLSEISSEEMLNYMIHFRGHQRLLGKLSEALDLSIDLYGFDDPKTKKIGQAAFLQVKNFCHCICLAVHLKLIQVYVCFTSLSLGGYAVLPVQNVS